MRATPPPDAASRNLSSDIFNALLDSCVAVTQGINGFLTLERYLVLRPHAKVSQSHAIDPALDQKDNPLSRSMYTNTNRTHRFRYGCASSAAYSSSSRSSFLF